MALSPSVLKGLIKSKIEAISDWPIQGAHPIFSDDRVLMALAEAIVEHITNAAEVTTEGADPQGGVVDSTGTVS